MDCSGCQECRLVKEFADVFELWVLVLGRLAFRVIGKPGLRAKAHADEALGF